MKLRFLPQNWRISDMGWILFKRALRDLKAGWARYVALSALIVFSIFIVTSLMGAAVTVIDYTELWDRNCAARTASSLFSCLCVMKSSKR